MSEVKEVKNSLVAKIMTVLGLGDEGKIGKFVAKEIKKANTAIKSLKHNLTAELSQYDIEKGKLKDRLEDANEAVEDAYANITPENVSTNAAMEEFAEVYWKGVVDAERSVESLTNQLKSLEDAFEKGGWAGDVQFEGTADLNSQIAKYETRIDRIS